MKTTPLSNPSERVSVPELDEILGRRWPVLNDGFIRVVDYLGGDSSIVQAARVSYGTGTKSVHEDAGLIRYLMRHSHTTPFEMCEIKLHIRAPMDVWRQWIRHRTANVNEYSTRYSIAIDAAMVTSPDAWRKQSAMGKQGSEGAIPQEVGERLTAEERSLQEHARHVYDDRIAVGVAREQARKDLPLSTYTEAYWKIDLHNLLHFLRLRLAEHAQHEIREYATIIGHEIVRRWCPVAWDAFVEYRLESVELTARDVRVIQQILAGNASGALQVAESYGWLTKNAEGRLRTNRERRETEQKLKVLGFDVPWAR